MKIDIEGHEYRALLGARSMLKRCRPAIISEYSPVHLERGSGVSGADYLRFLLDFGYRALVLPRSGEPQPVDGAEFLDEECKRLGHHLDLLLVPR